MANGFKIISSTLLIPNMGVNTSITRCTSEIFALSEWDVLTIRVLITLGQTKINDKNAVLIGFITSN
jgi:hypothetical protein